MPAEKIDFLSYFKVHQFFFSTIGIDVLSEKQFVTNYFLNVTPPFNVALLGLAMFHYAIVNRNDVGDVTGAFAAVLQILLVLCKWATFMYNRRKIIKLVRYLLNCNMEATEAQCAVIVIENKKNIRLCRYYFWASVACGSMAMASQYISLLKSYFQGVKMIIPAPFRNTYPFDYRKPLNYMLCELCLFFSIYAGVWISLSVDGLFSWFTRNTTAQLRVLALRLRQVGQENDGNVSMETLKNCIKYHCRITDVAADLNDIYGIIIFVKFSNSCIQLCFAAFQIIGGSADIIFDILFMQVVFMQLVLYCWNSQNLQDESLKVADYIYDSFKWEKVAIPQRKMLLLALLRAQRACNLKGVFFVADFRLLLWVVKTAYSMVALLQTIDN